MWSKGVLCALALIAAFPPVLGFETHIIQTMVNLWMRLTNENVYEFSIIGIHGETVPMSEYIGHPLIIINLPLDCEARRVFVLNLLAAQYYNKGLRIIGFPTADLLKIYPHDKKFPGAPVSKFITRNQINFNVYNTIKVDGSGTDLLWKYLKATQRYAYSSEDYTMYIVNKEGDPVKRIPGNLWLSYEKLVAIVAQYL